MLLPYEWIERGGEEKTLVQVRIPKIVSVTIASIPSNEKHLRSHGTGFLRHQSRYVPEHSDVGATKVSMGVTEMRQPVA